jgi:hypothetical protein
MEKQGMVRGGRFLRAGLLIIFLWGVSSGIFLWSQTDEDEAPGEVSGQESPLMVQIETTPALPVVYSPWSVYILVNHSSPSEVNVKPPRFPPSLVLERIRTELRFVRHEPEGSSGAASQNLSSPVQGERWTRVEFLFTPQRTGTITLESFEVTIPGKKAATGEISVHFREEPRNIGRYEPRFRWADPVSPVVTGERKELILDLVNWDPLKTPPRNIFQGRAPLNAILEEKPPLPTGEGAFRYAIALIPLEGTRIILEPFSFQAEGFALTVPAIAVALVAPAGAVPAKAAAALLPPQRGAAAPFPTNNEFPAPPFPENRKKIFPVFRTERFRIIARSQALWEEDRRAEALAWMRRNERDRVYGPLLAPIRREMEQTLGLGFTEDEKWRPLRIPLLFWIAGVIIALSTGGLVFFVRPRPGLLKKSVTSRRRRGFMTVVVFVLFGGAALILLEAGLGSFFMDRPGFSGNTAVLEKTPAYRVPDFSGAINARFGEGQPVIAGDSRGDWCYAESSDGRAGWVPKEAVITY